MKYEAIRAEVYRDAVRYLMCRSAADAPFVAALLNASDGMATEAIEALEDGGLGRVVAQRERLRAVVEHLMNLAESRTWPGPNTMDAARAALTDDA